MKHHDATTDQRAVEDSSDAVSTLEAKLEQAAAERLGVRLSEVWPENHSESRTRTDLPGVASRIEERLVLALEGIGVCPVDSLASRLNLMRVHSIPPTLTNCQASCDPNLFNLDAATTTERRNTAVVKSDPFPALIVDVLKDKICRLKPVSEPEP